MTEKRNMLKAALKTVLKTLKKQIDTFLEM